MNIQTLTFRHNNLLFKKINRDIPLLATLCLIVITGLVVYFFFPRQPKIVVINSNANDCPETIQELRLKDYKFTQPLMFADIPNENAALTSIKEKINEVIEKNKSLNMATGVSVYFRVLNDASWFVINPEKKYAPASLMKVSYLISMLKQSESVPGLLNRKIFFEKHFSEGYNQNIKNFTLKENKYYTVKELLRYMITYSDNDALTLIGMNTNADVYAKIFSDLGIPAPPMDAAKATEYGMSISDYCKFFRILYNSGYLSNENSDLALSMLSESTYKNGLLKNISADFPVAHKFGERVIGDVAQLHEVGIFYNGSHPYLLGVMSEGYNLKDLSTVLAQISQVAYTEFNGKI